MRHGEYPKWITAPNGKRCLTTSKEHEAQCVSENTPETPAQKKAREAAEKAARDTAEKAAREKEKEDLRAAALIRAQQEAELEAEQERIQKLDAEPPRAEADQSEATATGAE